MISPCVAWCAALFESLLQRLFMRGAFAGATADASYRVGLEEPVNTSQTMDRGQFSWS